MSDEEKTPDGSGPETPEPAPIASKKTTPGKKAPARKKAPAGSKEPGTGAALAEPRPAEPQPAEPQPAEPQPAEPQPAEPQPAEPQPAEPQPAEPQPAEPQPAEPQPAEPQPAEPQPAEESTSEHVPAQVLDGSQPPTAFDGQLIGEDGLPIDLDDDEVLDEIKPQVPGEAKKPDPDQYKKDFTKNQIEAVLFVSGQAVSAEEVAVKLNVGKRVVEEMLDKLALEYLERSTALEIAKVADKYILQLKPEFTAHVKSFATGGLIREAVMRTLTIIAAKQPILQSDLSKIRSAAGEHLKELNEMGLVKAVPKGRSKELTTTDKFADMFGFSRDVNQMKEQIKIYLTAATKDDGD